MQTHWSGVVCHAGHVMGLVTKQIEPRHKTMALSDLYLTDSVIRLRDMDVARRRQT